MSGATSETPDSQATERTFWSSDPIGFLSAPNYDPRYRFELSGLGPAYADLLEACVRMHENDQFRSAMKDPRLDITLTVGLIDLARFSIKLIRQGPDLPRIELWRDDAYLEASYELLLYQPDSAQSLTRLDTSMSPDWIDLSVAQGWMERCIREHGTQCQTTPHNPGLSPDWVIDTQNACLVRGDTVSEYVALSYIWGFSLTSPSNPQPEPISLTEKRKLGGLLKEGIFPPTVKDAIEVVRQLGERFLWVDSVCLASEDDGDLAKQLQMMGAIYASAKLTIVATDGDALHGLPGVRGSKGPRSLRNFVSCPGRQIFIRNLPELSSTSPLASEYFGRGWTYQEFLLSPRRLIFAQKQIHWSCGCSLWHEDLPAMDANHSGDVPEQLRFKKIFGGQPDLKELDSAIREYNNRDHTYREDAYPAVAGLLHLLSPSFPGGFLYGLPRVCFEAALMWSCTENTYTSMYWGSQRRTPCKKSYPLPNSELPSWSWVGWQTEDLDVLQGEDDFRLSGDRGWITIPITTWKSRSSVEATTEYDIHSNWFQYGMTRDEGLGALPSEWTCETYDPHKHQPPNTQVAIPLGASGDLVYRHPSAPGQYYWRPVPFPDSNGNDTSSISSNRQDHIITCQTKRGWFDDPRRHSDEYYSIFRFALDGNTGYGATEGSGWLQFASGNCFRKKSSKLYRLSELSSEQEELVELSTETAGLVELVAICRRFVPQEQSLMQNGHIQYNEYYGVLSVRWTDGVAYREGCGLIEKAIWEEHELEDVHLVLG